MSQFNHCKYCKYLDNLDLCIHTNEYKDHSDYCDKFDLDKTTVEDEL
jgi:hypothetical protein